MEPTTAMKLIEVQHGKPLREVLEILYEEHQSWGKIATLLGISRGTLHNWRRELGIDDVELRLTTSRS